jgi:acid phosphatase type 7
MAVGLGIVDRDEVFVVVYRNSVMCSSMRSALAAAPLAIVLVFVLSAPTLAEPVQPARASLPPRADFAATLIYLPFVAVAPHAVLAGAGDIAICGNSGSEQTAQLLDGIAGQVVTFGDNSNESGTAAQFADCFAPTWGRHRARIRPAPGNHDYYTAGASGYYGYYGSAAGDPAKGYYSYELGTWHVIALNALCEQVGGCQAGSAQEQWLRADLAAHPVQCTLAYWHKPRFSSGDHGNNADYTAFWQALYDAHAEVVMNGHDHDYERFGRQDPSGVADVYGIREFVVGTGGAGQRPFTTVQANSRVRNTGALGILKLSLYDGTYTWQFVPVAGQTFTDSGSGTCY